MNEKRLRVILGSKKELGRLVNFFISKRVLFKNRFDEFELKGHLEKSKHNLKFVGDNFKLGYLDWVVTGCYYAVYHSVLSLILSRGYFSKNHDASLTILIKEFYEDFSKEAAFINKLFIDYNDVCFYVQSKNQRELASYSSSFVLSREEVKGIVKKTIEFVNKAIRLSELFLHLL